jgi:peroxiredoxin
VSRPKHPPLDIEAIGPPVGERLPDVSLPDQDGRLVNLHDVRNGQRALVLFIRSADW